MLSFQREPDPGNGTPAPEGNGGDQDYVTVKSKRDTVRRSTTVVVILFVVGLLGLWFMIKKSTPENALAQTDTTEETRIQTAISQLTGLKSEMLDKVDTVLTRLYEFSDVQQVEVGELAKNPFEMEIFGADADEPLPLDGDVVDMVAVRRQKAGRLAAELNLQSIVHADTDQADNCCMINGEVLKAGGRIDDFEVRGITRAQVVLLWAPKDANAQDEEIQVVLKLAQ